MARDDFATATYLAFENRGYVRVADGRRFAMTFRAAGAFVAEVRGIGEDYLAFYCSRHAPSDAASGEATRLDAAVRDAIARVGWRPETREGTGD